MTTSQVGLGRVPVTGPLDPTAITLPVKPVTVVGESSPDAFGCDGGTTAPLGTDGVSANRCDFGDAPIPTTDPVPGQWLAKVDVALTTQGAALTQADDAITASTTGPATAHQDTKRSGLINAQTALSTSLTAVSDMVTALDGYLQTLAADHPQRAELETKLGQLKDLQTALTTKQTEVGHRITTYDSTVKSLENLYDKRIDTLGDLAAILDDPTKTPKDKADAIGTLIATYKANGALTSTVSLLKDVQHYLRGETTRDGKTITLDYLTTRATDLKNPQKLRPAEHSALTRIVAGAKTSMTTAVSSGVVYTPSKHTGFAVPKVPVYSAASDSDSVARNGKITQTYKDLEVAMQAYLGTSMSTWLTMGANASSECGKQLGHNMIQDGLTMVTNPGAAIGFLTNGDAHLDDFWAALKAGNREIYNTIAPAIQIFLAAEAKGEDGVAALLASEHYQKGLMHNAAHPSYSETAPLINALKALQQASRTSDPQAKADLIFESIKGIAIYEQKSVLGPIIGDPGDGAYETMKEISPAMAWTPPGTDEPVSLLPNGGNWADYDTRIAAIIAGPAAWFNAQNHKKSH